MSYPHAPGFVAGSCTSKAAAHSMKESAGIIRRRIESFVSEQSDGVTCDEIEQALELSHQTASARCTELKQQGRIVTRVTDAGKALTRPTRSGRAAKVFFTPDN